MTGTVRVKSVAVNKKLAGYAAVMSASSLLLRTFQAVTAKQPAGDMLKVGKAIVKELSVRRSNF